jgi:hypothetical protein
MMDLTANYVLGVWGENAFVYNIMTVAEQALILIIYYLSRGNKTRRFSYLAGALLIVLLGFSNKLLPNPPGGFNIETFIFSGILVAIFSYLELRRSVLDLKIDSIIIWFASANMIYYTLMVSSMSAQPLAQRISMKLAENLKYINDVAYMIWAILIAIGLIWSRKSNI